MNRTASFMWVGDELGVGMAAGPHSKHLVDESLTDRLDPAKVQLDLAELLEPPKRSFGLARLTNSVPSSTNLMTSRVRTNS
jgi:hypothetical protein